MTLRPSRVSRVAAVLPAGPPPMTSTSHSQSRVITLTLGGLQRWKIPHPSEIVRCLPDQAAGPLPRGRHMTNPRTYLHTHPAHSAHAAARHAAVGALVVLRRLGDHHLGREQQSRH